MNIEQLKAHAYDCISQIEVWQEELRATNKKIEELKKTPVEKKETE